MNSLQYAIPSSIINYMKPCLFKIKHQNIRRMVYFYVLCIMMAVSEIKKISENKEGVMKFFHVFVKT